MDRGALRVMVVRAEGLRRADLNGKADPYVKAVIRHSTRLLEDFKNDELILHVCDRDVLKHDDAMGDVRIKLHDLSAERPKLEFFEPLTTEGRMMFTVSWEQVAPVQLRHGKMEVHLMRATNLLAADRNGLSDPYCKLTWLGQKSRSKVIHKSLAPAWFERFTFKGVLHELLACPLRLRLYDYDRLGRDDPLGEARVDLRGEVGASGALDVEVEVPLDLPDGCKEAKDSRVTLHVRWEGDEASAAQVADSARDETGATDVILLHGKLQQRSSKGLWKDRWIELTGHDLVTYRDQEDEQPCGVLPLAFVARIEAAADSARFVIHVDVASRSSVGGSSVRASASGVASASGGGGGGGGKRSVLELQALGSKKTDDAALQRQRWVRAIRLLIGQEFDPLDRIACLASQAMRERRAARPNGGAAPPADEPAEVRQSSFGDKLDDAALGAGSFAGRQVPQTLLLLWAELSGRSKDGLELEGIFRLSADASEVSTTKQRLHDARSIDVAKGAAAAASGYCLAALIKLYLRDARGAVARVVPDDLWGDARPQLDASVRATEAGTAGAADWTAVLRQLSPRSHALFSWCCDVCAAVVAREPENSMNATAVATVLAPGLVRPPHSESDPMAVLDYSRGAVMWLEHVLVSRATSASAAEAAAAAAAAMERVALESTERLATEAATAVPQERTKMRRVSQLAAVAGLEESPLAAACGVDDIEIESARLHKLHDVYRVDSDRMLSKKRPSKQVRDEALAKMMLELEELGEEGAGLASPAS